MSIELPKGFKIICEFLAGSHLYGTSTPESDVDLRGVFIPTKEYFYGFLSTTRNYQDKQNDIEYKEIREFMKLAISQNPTVIEYLFVPPEKLQINTPEWQTVVENRNLFLSRQCRRSFMGYAIAQIKRIKTHRAWLLNPPKKKPERKDFGLPEERKMISGDQMGAFNSLLADYLEQISKYNHLKDELLELEETHNYKALLSNIRNVEPEHLRLLKPIHDVSENFIEVYTRERGYKSALQHWKQYQHWVKTRNPARAALEAKFGYDTKHGMHLYRLTEECFELLETGHITLPRPNAKELLKIRDGKYSYDELMERFEWFENETKKKVETSVLPEKPKHKQINNLCISICENFLKGTNDETGTSSSNVDRNVRRGKHGVFGF
jgi:hypothetical protein